jgi:cardiolipin synthase
LNNPPAALIVADQPGVRRVEHMYAWLASHAEHTLDITDAYMIAPPAVLDAFESAASRGVDIRILLPGHNNHPLAGAAARRLYQPLMNAGVRIFEWKRSPNQAGQRPMNCFIALGSVATLSLGII